jgi:TolB-like protein
MCGHRKTCKQGENAPKLCQGSTERERPVPNDRSAVLSVHRFGGFTLDNHRGVLLSPEGQEIALRPKALQLLRLLVENGGEVIDRERIMRSVWPEVTIGDDGITQCVRDIRRALGDEAQRIIRTLPKRGYVLGVEVVRERAEIADAARRVQDKPSIAVLPFTDLAADPAQMFFAEGIADDILTALSRNRGLTVIARGSSFAQRGRDPQAIALALSVRYVVQGSVRRDGERMRIFAQLIDAEGGRQVWGERYDRDLADLFSVQDDISSAVVTAVQPALADAEAQRVFRISPENLGAWEAYHRGLWHMGRASLPEMNEARTLLARAVALDPMFARAHAAMAHTWMLAGFVFATHTLNESVEHGQHWARRAVALDPWDADALAILTWIVSATQGISQEHFDGLLHALAINPNSTWAHAAHGATLLFSGHFQEARTAHGVALRLDPSGPVSVFPLSQIALSYYLEGNYSEAVNAARRAAFRYPQMPLGYRTLAAALGQLGRIEEARAALQAAIDVSPQGFVFPWFRRLPGFRTVDYEHLLDGLRKAGWQG